MNAKRTSYKIVLGCCGRTVYRGAERATFKCHWCGETRRPRSVELMGGEAGLCPRGHLNAYTRNVRGDKLCVPCARENARRYREKASA